MKKKILIGSCIAIILVIVMPSIPAVQQKIVKEELKEELSDKLDLNNVKNIKKCPFPNDLKHPILYFLVKSIINFQYARLGFYAGLMMISVDMDGDHPGLYEITHPLLFIVSLLRIMIMMGVIIPFDYFWLILSYTFGWNWYT